MTKQSKQHRCQVERPLPHRPGIVKVTLPSGRVVVDRVNDRHPISGEERAALYGRPMDSLAEKVREMFPKAEAVGSPSELAALASAREALKAARAEVERLSEEARVEAGPGALVEVRPGDEIDRAEVAGRRCAARVRNLERSIPAAARQRERDARPHPLTASEAARVGAVGLAVPGELREGAYWRLMTEVERRERGESESVEAKIARLEAALVAAGGGA